jgi:hypothetical protein
MAALQREWGKSVQPLKKPTAKNKYSRADTTDSLKQFEDREKILQKTLIYMYVCYISDICSPFRTKNGKNNISSKNCRPRTINFIQKN